MNSGLVPSRPPRRPPPSRRIGPRELTRLLGAWPSSTAPAYAALAGRIRLVILDGRLPVGVRLPPERELALTLGLSRTTVSAAFDVLRESGHAASRQGSGTWTTLPTAGAPVPTWAPEPAPEGVLDLAHAAPGAPPHLHAAYTAALEELPRYLPGTGYDYRGLVSLRERLAERFTERGLATTADQVLVTSGALQAVRLGLTLAAGAGDRVLVEQPGYPNGLDVVTDLGARLVPVPVDPTALTWDLDSLGSAARQTSPTAAYLVPEFQNPTGALMSGEVREQVARTLDRSGTVAVVDETLVELAVDGLEMPPPLAVFAGRTPVVTVGSASKIAWGGLRMGWLRSDAATVARLAALRSRQDLASPVLEQLALLHLLGELDDLRTYRVDQLRQGRDVLTGLLAAHLPDWRVVRPAGGQVLWCALPAPSASDLAAAAADLGVRLTPGSRFAADGGLESWVRLPFALPVDVLARAVPLVAQAWDVVTRRPAGGRRPAPDDDAAYVV
ncbi:MocR-like transcription factor YczR [Angustibacter luteus]|uniref:PLP-dependent aminotransferase family protein n=1 Tax=Angustibacter luteus TaxID=658456 RepID=A0ABW1JJ28_9ACTN